MRDGSNEGARRVAILLSVLEPKTVCDLLGMFEPRVANAIADEAKVIKNESISTKEIETIVQKFVNSFLDTEPDLAKKIQEQANRVLRIGRNDECFISEKLAPSENKESVSLNWDSIDWVLVAQRLAKERPTTVSCILNSFPMEYREKVLSFLPQVNRVFFMKEKKIRHLESVMTKANVSMLIETFFEQFNT